MRIFRTADNFQILPNDEAQHLEEKEFDAKFVREKKIRGLIQQAFARCGLTISGNNYPIYYDEASGREATVELEDSAVPLSKLMNLLKSGLSNDYTIGTFQHGVEISFVVNPELDNVQ